MDTDRMTYKQFDDLLVQLGFSRAHVEPKWLRYEHAASDTVIVVADKKQDEPVRITDAVSARRHLVEKGLITEKEIEAIVSRNASAQETVSAKKR
jgi:hypothetical protein